MASFFLRTLQKPYPERRESRYKWTRRMGNSWWARPCLSFEQIGIFPGFVNLGLFRASRWGSLDGAERAAGIAAREFISRCSWPDVDIWEVLEQMQTEGIVPEHVLPSWVVRVPGGFGARRMIRSIGAVILVRGPFVTAREAHWAMRRKIQRLGVGNMGRYGTRPIGYWRGVEETVMA